MAAPKTIRRDDDLLRELWATELSCIEIGKRFGASRNWVSKRARQIGLARRATDMTRFPGAMVEAAYVDHDMTLGEIVEQLRPYDSVGRRVVRAGEFRGESDLSLGQIPAEVFETADAAVLERPKGYGPTRPQLVECGIVFGDLRRHLREMSWGRRGFYAVEVHELLRLQVCQTLTEALHGVIRVRNDATAWAALIELHGDGSDAKPRTKKGVVVSPGGALGLVTGHARAALAVAVAFALRQSQTTGGVL